MAPDCPAAADVCTFVTLARAFKLVGPSCEMLPPTRRPACRILPARTPVPACDAGGLLELDFVEQRLQVLRARAP